NKRLTPYCDGYRTKDGTSCPWLLNATFHLGNMYQPNIKVMFNRVNQHEKIRLKVVNQKR
ncbi:MAG: hypothetical protein PUG75_11165, partial [Prevotella sp.]|nr:hypothetical protein [Prevotella sp.]